MVSVRLRNPDIILTPITDAEKTKIEQQFRGDESIYVLYRLPDSDSIHIGMMSSSMRRHFPVKSNAWLLGAATEKAFFYNGCSDLAKRACEITDRPVYRIRPTDKRIVADYDVLNGTEENGLSILLEDVVNGSYVVRAEKPPVLKK